MDRSPTPARPAGTAHQETLGSDFARWLDQELGKPGFSAARTLVVTIACTGTMLAIQQFGF